MIEIGVVIPTHDRKDSVLRCLASLIHQSLPHPAFEVIVVGDHCTDDTVEAVRGLQAPFALRVCESAGRGAAAARNLGAAQSQAPLLLFLDDDMEAVPDLLAAHVHEQREHPGSIVLGYFPMPAPVEGESLFAKHARLWWEEGFAARREPAYRFTFRDFCSGNVSVPSQVFHRLGGFWESIDHRASGEDYEFGLRALHHQVRFVFSPAAKSIHHSVITRQVNLYRAEQDGAGHALMARRHPELFRTFRLCHYAQTSRKPGYRILWRLLWGRSALISAADGLLTVLFHVFALLGMRSSLLGAQHHRSNLAYCLGIRRALGLLGEWERLVAAGDRAAAVPEPEYELEIEADLGHLDRLLSEQPVTAVRFVRNGVSFGRISFEPGAEALRPVHVRDSLVRHHGGLLLGALTEARLYGLREDGSAAPDGLDLRTRTTSVPVSVVVPARDSAETLAATLESLEAQTHQAWEAIIVNDASGDDTQRIALEFCARDSRFRVLDGSGVGAGAARNQGIEAARFEWLLFLDADDTIDPRHLELMTAAAASNPAAGAVHCGFCRLRSGELLFGDEHCPDLEDLSDRFAGGCGFVIHACLVKKAVVVAVGGFDERLTCCEDWDLWQRIARVGTVFRSVPGTLARYHLRTGSLSRNTRQMLSDGLEVILRTHSPWVRTGLVTSDPMADPKRRCEAQLYYACYCVGLMLPSGGDWGSVVREIEPPREAPIDTDLLANVLREGLLVAGDCSAGELRDRWVERWASAGRAFLAELEQRTESAGLAKAVEIALSSALLVRPLAVAQLALGPVYAVRVDAAQPFHDVVLPGEATRYHVTVHWAGRPMGSVMLPAVARRVRSDVLRDAISARLAWPLLGAFFADSVYRDLRITRDGSRAEAWRHELLLHQWTVGDEPFEVEIHNQLGWLILLQEVWGKQDWSSAQFYDAAATGTLADAHPGPAKDSESLQNIEIAAALPIGITPSQSAVPVSLGGVPLGLMPIDAGLAILREEQWIAAVSTWAGFELAVATVRDCVLGAPADKSIRARLHARLFRDAEDFARDSQGEPSPALLGRRWPGVMGTSASRRSTLPGSGADSLLELARRHREYAGGGGEASEVRYVPELLPADGLSFDLPGKPGIDAGPSQPRDTSLKLHFESLYAATTDPWGYSNEYEALKYEQTVSLVRGLSIGPALELACAEGRFTQRLAPLVESVLATDISAFALERAVERCAQIPNVSFRTLDMVSEDLGGPWDLVVCSEVLYYMGTVDQLREVAFKIMSAVRNGGYFLTAHANLVVDEPDRPGFDWEHEFGAKAIGETFAGLTGVYLVQEIRTTAYRIQLFRKGGGNGTVRVVQQSQATMPPKVARRFLPRGGVPVRSANLDGTARLPILMYHSITADRSKVGRFRLYLGDFERQLRFLHDNGIRTITPGGWGQCMLQRRPAPGRAVMLTFDDGYTDFYYHALPVLRAYGCGSVVFLVTDRVGRRSAWTGADGAELMTWDQVSEAASSETCFGSHSSTHRSLMSMSLEAVTRELSESRLRLEERLGAPVTSVAYPYGLSDEAIRHLADGCGYLYGFGAQGVHASLRSDPRWIPRIEVTGTGGFRSFVALFAGD